MIDNIYIFINFSIGVFTLFLLLNPIEWVINYFGKIITFIVKNVIKTAIILYSAALAYVWIQMVLMIIYESIYFYQSNNYQFTNDNLNEIAIKVFERVVWKHVVLKK